MLNSLLIKNYALIKNLEMEPSPGLNVITGETGAGKSIMVGAVGLLLGNRADSKVLLDKDRKCIVEGGFNIEMFSLKSFFKNADLDYESECIIRREINPNGKSRAFINDTPVNLETLKTLGSRLMEVHSQLDTLLLGQLAYQLSIIDLFAGNTSLLSPYKASFKEYQTKNQTLISLQHEVEQWKKEADYNNFLLQELIEAQLQPEVDETLEEDLKLLENAEEIKLKINQILELLDQSDFSVSQNLYTIGSLIDQISSYSDKFQALKNRTQSSLIEIKDIIGELENEQEMVVHNPQKIEEMRERINLIYRLEQKHQVQGVENLTKIQDELDIKAQKILNLDDEIHQAQTALEDTKREMIECAHLLSKSRKSVYSGLATELEQLLVDLGMPDAQIKIKEQSKDPDLTGIDDIEILFSANKGIPPQTLKRVASGGEFSRLMFCIKYILAGKIALPTIIFDEIDTGVSGEIALKMVNMMKNMSKDHQVITISHLPQFAAKGDTHYFVYKDSSTQTATSNIKKLSNQERILEVAKMIGGESPSDIAYENAKELLELKLK
ncbi:MAG: DNA repair protein RecN [Bacteroidetes bacterium]|nr:DNA repair protein RecN [Bacteroidota bacterium]